MHVSAIKHTAYLLYKAETSGVFKIKNIIHYSVNQLIIGLFSI